MLINVSEFYDEEIDTSLSTIMRSSSRGCSSSWG